MFKILLNISIYYFRFIICIMENERKVKRGFFLLIIIFYFNSEDKNFKITIVMSRIFGLRV